ncbi:hypothetical protein J6590_006420 [Homalodisca vitripennis]|nr:hypothetical protein J6590_006420 [Homalodisca vitripennis]
MYASLYNTTPASHGNWSINYASLQAHKVAFYSRASNKGKHNSDNVLASPCDVTPATRSTWSINYASLQAHKVAFKQPSL